ncbi:MAG: hypothetical protein ACPG3X_06380 [Opitutales bacterium]
MPQADEIETLVIEVAQMLAEDFELEGLSTPTGDSPLYGSGGPLDSMALVNLIADVEVAVSEKFGASIVLADEKAMSAKNSPFRSVASLTEAVIERMPQ